MEQIEGATRTCKIAGFDLDGTLIVRRSGRKYALDHKDWKLFHSTLVQKKLDELVRQGYTLAIISNQNGVARGHVTAAQMQVTKATRGFVCCVGACFVGSFVVTDWV